MSTRRFSRRQRRRYDRWTVAGVIAGASTFLLLIAAAVLLISMRPLPHARRRQARIASRPARVSESVAPPPARPAPTVVSLPIDIPPLHPFDERATYAWLIRDAASRRALSPKLVEAIVRVESDFNPREVSNKGALGIMQVIPSTGARFGVHRHELFDPARNIAAGTAYLAWLRNRYRGDLDRMLAAYNAGEGAVDRYDGVPPFPETREYVRRVRAELAVLQ